MDRVAAVVGTTDPLAQLPTRQEVADEIARMEADPAYISKWTGELVEMWIAELEAEVAP